jgi:DNA-nicking Smr family endonuclease
MRRRETSLEERELFKKAFSESRPLRVTSGSKKSGNPPIRPGGSGGLDGHTSERLRRGLLEPEARLDLHGLTENVAHHALLTFLRGAHARGLRLVLVVTGKGAPKLARADSGIGGLGVLRAAVPRWLKEAPFSPLVAGAAWSHVRHGGEGALYVYLRKPHR